MAVSEELQQALSRIIVETRKNLVTLSVEKFIEIVGDAPLEDKKALLEKFRNNKLFYKRVLEEPRRKERPNSVRYRDAEIKIGLINEKGKYLSKLIKEESA